jgi:hypothetical protein
MNPTICKAIEERRILELRYHGFSRIVEPHVYGEDKKGNEVVRCYQLAGESESGERAGWKLLRIKEAVIVHLSETLFIPRPEYRRNDKVVMNVFCQV